MYEFETSDAVHFIHFKKNGWLQPAVPSDVAKYWPKEERDHDGQFAVYRAHLSVIAYNTKLVSKADAPKSHADLLNPKWAGKMVKAHPRLQRHNHGRTRRRCRRRWAGATSRSSASRR